MKNLTTFLQKLLPKTKTHGAGTNMFKVVAVRPCAEILERANRHLIGANPPPKEISCVFSCDIAGHPADYFIQWSFLSLGTWAFYYNVKSITEYQGEEVDYDCSNFEVKR